MTHQDVVQNVFLSGWDDTDKDNRAADLTFSAPVTLTAGLSAVKCFFLRLCRCMLGRSFCCRVLYELTAALQDEIGYYY